MRGYLTVNTQEEFDKWIREQLAEQQQMASAQ
jgi:heme/copper-type cytochrome/quinol oxidase subunit 2